MDPLAIANLALGWLGQKEISSFDDATAAARKIKAAFDGLRDAVLADRDWSFALRRMALDLDPVKPLFHYVGRYRVPNTVLRVVRAKPGDSDTSIAAVRMTSGEEWPDLDWAVENAAANADGSGDVGRYVVAMTDVNPLHVQALVQVEDPVLWSPGFCQALAARLAADLCVPLTGNGNRADSMWVLYDKKLNEAAANDGRQGSAKRIVSTYFHARRG